MDDAPRPIHPATQQILRHFELRDYHAPPLALHIGFRELAHDIATLLDGPEVTVALRKMLEAQDCVERALQDGVRHGAVPGDSAAKDDAAVRAAQALCEKGPAQGTRWRHYKGGTYTVLHCAVVEATLEPVVVYQSEARGSLWTRPVAVWNESVLWEGATVPRFAPVEGAP